MPKPRIMYIENKSTGEAHIGRVTFSRSGRTIYYKDQTFIRANCVHGNYILSERDPNESGADTYDPSKKQQEFWISGCKKDGTDSLHDPVNVIIDEDVFGEYWRDIRGKK